MSDAEENLLYESQETQTNLGESNQIFEWVLSTDNFIPGKNIVSYRNCKISENLTLHLSQMQIFHKIFSYSLDLQLYNVSTSAWI